MSRDMQLTNESFYKMGYEDMRQRVAKQIEQKLIVCKNQKKNGFDTDSALIVLNDLIERLNIKDLITLDLLK